MATGVSKAENFHVLLQTFYTFLLDMVILYEIQGSFSKLNLNLLFFNFLKLEMKLSSECVFSN